MNNSTVNHSSFDNLSLQKFLLPTFIFWTVVGLLNALSSACNVYILLVWKPMLKDTLFLTIEMCFMEMFGGLVLMSVGIFHVSNTLLDKAESRPMLNCWYIVCWDMLSSLVIGIIYFELSFDRFYAAVFPIQYQYRTKYYSYILSIIAWILSLIIFSCSLFAISNEGNNVVSICLLRYTLGTLYFSVFSYFLFASSVLAIAVYCIILVVLKIQIQLTLKHGGNIIEVKKRMNSKVTKTLAASAFAHLLTFTTAACGTQMVTYFLPFNGGTYGPLFNTFYHFGSITSLPIYCLFQRQFRMGFIHLCKIAINCKCKKNISTVVTLSQVRDGQTNVVI